LSAGEQPDQDCGEQNFRKARRPIDQRHQSSGQFDPLHFIGSRWLFL
jgi:hypothetical protein